MSDKTVEEQLDELDRVISGLRSGKRKHASYVERDEGGRLLVVKTKILDERIGD